VEKKSNAIKDKSYQFALRIIKLYQYLAKEKKEFVLSKQILRSGTAVGALVQEATQGESKADFIHKLSMANKEASETSYWICLLRDSSLIDEKAAQSILKDNNEIIKILASIILTTKTRLKK
jgi:four helix bundle protein